MPSPLCAVKEEFFGHLHTTMSASLPPNILSGALVTIPSRGDSHAYSAIPDDDTAYPWANTHPFNDIVKVDPDDSQDTTDFNFIDLSQPNGTADVKFPSQFHFGKEEFPLTADDSSLSDVKPHHDALVPFQENA